jgi:hypothetical protein
MSLGGQGNSRGTGVLQRVVHACAPLAILENQLLPVGTLVAGIAKGAGWCSRVKRGIIHHPNSTETVNDGGCACLCTP